MTKSFDTKTIYKGIILMLLIVVCFFLYKEIGERQKYYAVYLTSGDVYFGKMRSFPSLVIEDAYFLQAANTAEGGVYTLSKFSDAMWKPTGRIKLNRDHVLWVAELEDGSETVSYIKQGGVVSSSQLQQEQWNEPQVNMDPVTIPEESITGTDNDPLGVTE
jgi:hypothetical protein